MALFFTLKVLIRFIFDLEAKKFLNINHFVYFYFFYNRSNSYQIEISQSFNNFFRSMIRILAKKTFNLLNGPLLRAPLTTDATYMKAKNRPLNIAHRGLSGLIPQNTIPAFQAALYSGADFIELDVVYTKDNQLLVMHDPYLHRITNIQEGQFPHAFEERYYPSDEKIYKTHWTDKLTLAELRQLKVKQKQAKHRISSLDFYFGMPTLEQVIEKVILFNSLHLGATNPDKMPGGIMIQSKDGDMYRDRYGQTKPHIGIKILQVLEKYRLHTWKGSLQRSCPIILQSFDDKTVEQWHQAGTDLPRHLLVEKATLHKKQPRGLVEYVKTASTFCHGIGVEDTLLYDAQGEQPYKDVVDGIRELNMGLHVWTFKDDDAPFKRPDEPFEITQAVRAYEIGQNELKLDGVITQFCNNYRYISEYIREQK